ncbi:cell envelope integrity protein CreD [Bacteroides sp. 51]|uniref:cell envelope integrity protein CreD n=1 Tax=Bacteroides sp. 51 TaxID=2302938 RepID=UPI0013D32704|nr:cell envelope integrity protein CreD [Bacteroides sp. 51]NDV84573.1 cell envelope integrity protein CreD [Bacteroides sp. 51]
MENLSDYSNNYPNEKKPGFFQRNAKTLKAVTIGFLVLLLLIPMNMIEDLIRERDYTENEAVGEVSQKWSGRQTIIGPYLNFDYIITHESMVDGKKNISTETKNLTLLPDELTIDGNLFTEIRRRGIYEVNVYQSALTLKGTFSPEELNKRGIDMEKICFENVTLCLGVADMRGISEQIQIKLGDSIYDFESGMNGKEIGYSGVSKIIDVPELKEQTIPYEINLKLKGSQSMFFIPVGKTTKINLQADWGTPSFDGSYLPESHDVTEEGFTAKWQVLNLNRSYPQTAMNFSNASDIKESRFGVNLRMPVEQYQQSMRTAKYAVLIILLTFVVIFFVETIDKKRIHVLQYLLIGLGLCLFYSLLLSMSEQMSFTLAYIIAAALTVGLIGLYMRGIMKKTKPALIMSGLLLALYTYIYVLIQLETLALLAGSLGLFVILAILMYFSKKIDWFSAN